MNVRELLEKRAALGEQARAIINKAETETRGLNAEETEKYKKLKSDIDGISALIAHERELSSALTAVEIPTEENRGKPGKPTDKPTDKAASEEYRDAFRAFLTYGLGECPWGRMTPEQRNLVLEMRTENRAGSPLSDITGALGGYTVPQGFYTTLTDAMKWFGGMRQSKATVLRTASGNVLPIPTANDTSNTGELLDENTTATQATSEISFGQVQLRARKYSSKIILVPIELLQDSAFDMSTFLAKKLGQRIGRITNTHFTTGTGTNQPMGVVTGSTLGVTGGSGYTVTVAYDDLVGLKHSVDVAYRANGQWMINDSTAAVLEKLKDANNRPLLNSTLQGVSGEVNGGDIKGGATLLGYPVVINNDMPVMAANAKSILFGDFSNYYIRDVMEIQLVRFQEKYMDAGQIGFLAYYRGDGVMVDAGMHPIKYYANSAS